MDIASDFMRANRLLMRGYGEFTFTLQLIIRSVPAFLIIGIAGAVALASISSIYPRGVSDSYNAVVAAGLVGSLLVNLTRLGSLVWNKMLLRLATVDAHIAMNTARTFQTEDKFGDHSAHLNDALAKYAEIVKKVR